MGTNIKPTHTFDELWDILECTDKVVVQELKRNVYAAKCEVIDFKKPSKLLRRNTREILIRDYLHLTDYYINEYNLGKDYNILISGDDKYEVIMIHDSKNNYIKRRVRDELEWDEVEDIYDYLTKGKDKV